MKCCQQQVARRGSCTLYSVRALPQTADCMPPALATQCWELGIACCPVAQLPWWIANWVLLSCHQGPKTVANFQYTNTWQEWGGREGNYLTNACTNWILSWRCLPLSLSLSLSPSLPSLQLLPDAARDNKDRDKLRSEALPVRPVWQLQLLSDCGIYLPHAINSCPNWSCSTLIIIRLIDPLCTCRYKSGLHSSRVESTQLDSRYMNMYLILHLHLLLLLLLLLLLFI